MKIAVCVGKYLFWLAFILGVMISPVAALADDFSYGPKAAGKVSGAAAPASVPKCYTEPNGRGRVIEWARTKRQCELQSTGRSWGHYGHYENIYRDILP